MDKAAIIGTFDFLAFQVCKALLEEGLEVAGYLYPLQDMNTLEDKHNEIGRNGNFELNLITNRSSSEIDTLILSFYDLFIMDKEEMLKSEELWERLSCLAKSLSIREGFLTLLLPVQLMSVKECAELELLRGAVKRVSKLFEKILIVYIPPLYGQEQPETCLLQKNEMKREYKTSENVDCQNDAIYVEDAAQSIADVIETGKTGIYDLLSTGEGANLLKRDS